MGDIFNIMGFLFSVPDPQGIPQNIPNADQKIPGNGHQVTSGRLEKSENPVSFSSGFFTSMKF
jgi:hypothetical protein